jgi:membrane protein
VLDVSERMVHETVEDRVTGLAAEVAFYSLLSLFPLLLVFGSLLGVLDDIVGQDLAMRAEDAVIDGLGSLLTDEGSGLVDAFRRLFESPSPGLFSIGLLLTLWTASRAFAAVLNGLDVVYDLDERRPWIRQRALGLALALGTAVVFTLVLAMIVVGPLLGTGSELASDIGVGGGFEVLWNYARPVFLVLVLVLWAATLYHVAPHHQTTWRSDLPGAVLAAVLWGLGTIGLQIYLEFGGGTNLVAGVVGSVLVVVLWFYVMSIGMLIGGQLNAVLGQRRAEAEA